MSGLIWRAQHPSYPPRPGEGLLHFAVSPKGTFEIYEDESGANFLLSAPRRMNHPAELFASLEDAKAGAETLLRESP
jgi:hypothetical protein